MLSMNDGRIDSRLVYIIRVLVSQVTCNKVQMMASNLSQ